VKSEKLEVSNDQAISATSLRAPFPWFGGKRRIAPAIWPALGAVDNYVEPFAGSLATCRTIGEC